MESVLLILVVIAALAGGLFAKVKPSTVVLTVAFAYFIAAFFLFDRTDSLWFVTLMMGFCQAAVGAMAAAYAGRALAKLLPGRR